MSLNDYDQYRRDIFQKLNFQFIGGNSILDLGCGDGADSIIFKNEYSLNVTGLDIYKHENIKKLDINFVKASIFDIPFSDNSFDYVFLHDVLHHIDEPKQRKQKHINGLEEIRRVTKNNGYIIIIEGNRYNPLFYPHMVLLNKHDHFKQSYFKNIVKTVFSEDLINFKFFESHLYPSGKNILWQIYEWTMENIMPKFFISYNSAIIRKK